VSVYGVRARKANARVAAASFQKPAPGRKSGGCRRGSVPVAANREKTDRPKSKLAGQPAPTNMTQSCHRGAPAAFRDGDDRGKASERNGAVAARERRDFLALRADDRSAPDGKKAARARRRGHGSSAAPVRATDIRTGRSDCRGGDPPSAASAGCELEVIDPWL
jgi:hypothetical protein